MRSRQDAETGKRRSFFTERRAVAISLSHLSVRQWIWYRRCYQHLPQALTLNTDKSVFRYDSDLIGGSLMVRESRIVADLLLNKADDIAWKEAIMDENRLQKTRPASAKRIAQAIRKRLDRLPQSFWQLLRDGDDQLATQVAFCTALARNLLLVEFIETVVSDALTIQSETLESYQWEEFLVERAYRDPKINDWAISSREKMRQVVFRMLCEVGVIADNQRHKLQPVLFRPELIRLLEYYELKRILNCLLILGPR